jgi:hypothetical protein
MGTTGTLKRLEYVSLVPSALALLVTFLSLPQAPAAGCGTALLARQALRASPLEEEASWTKVECMYSS